MLSFCHQSVRTPTVPHAHRHFVLSIFLDFVVLICLPLLRDEKDYNLIGLIAIYVSSLLRCVLRSLTIFLIWLFSYYEVWRIICIFWSISLYQIVCGKCFLLVCDFHFCSLDSILCRAEMFNFIKIQLIHYFFHRLWLWHCIWKAVFKPRSPVF